MSLLFSRSRSLSFFLSTGCLLCLLFGYLVIFVLFSFPMFGSGLVSCWRFGDNHQSISFH